MTEQNLLDLDALEAEFTPVPLPPCSVCGAKLGIVEIGGGRPTIYACTSTEIDRQHYSASRYRHTGAGDSRVVSLIQRVRQLEEALAKQAPLEEATLRFPTMLRKMWSGGEVQEWINNQGPLFRAPMPNRPSAGKTD
ncbi:hypothetical protein [Geopseudomonas aromaticivorans]